VESVHDVRDMARLPAWLSTTARRESLRTLALHRRYSASADRCPPGMGNVDSPERNAVLWERDRTLWTAVSSLSSQCQRVLRCSVHVRKLTHAELGCELGISVDSVGRIRKRCLAKVRRRLAVLGLPGAP